MFGDAGDQSVHKEMKQLHERKVPIPVYPANISSGSRSAALKYLMSLKMKRGTSIKGHGCDDRQSQRSHTSKEESIFPTVSIESLILPV